MISLLAYVIEPLDLRLHTKKEIESFIECSTIGQSYKTHNRICVTKVRESSEIETRKR
jgi:hypothetical protein